MINKDRYIELLIKKESGEITTHEEEELYFLKGESEVFETFEEVLLKLTTNSVKLRYVNKDYVKSSWEQIADTINHPSNKDKKNSRLLILKLAWAAVLILVLGLAYFSQRRPTLNQPGSEIVTQEGSNSKITLNDGTVVLLKSDSKLNFDELFTPTNRVVTLSGEGFFEVKHDPAHPFIIHTNKGDIKVLGTTFNVRNYPDEKRIEATLFTGKIEVTLKDQPEKSIVLQPMQKISISNEKANSDEVPSKALVLVELTNVKKEDSADNQNTQTLAKLVFVNKSLEEIAKELEIHFNTKITFLNSEAGKFRYTGTFKDGDLDYILKVLQLSKKFNYKLENNKVIIE